MNALAYGTEVLTFEVPTWYSIGVVWEKLFETAGLYNRVSWQIERWIWSAEEGYETMDYIQNSSLHVLCPLS